MSSVFSLWFLLAALVLAAPHVDRKLAFRAAWGCVAISVIFHIVEKLVL